MKKTGLADSPFFATPTAKEQIAPPLPEGSESKKKDGPDGESKAKTSVDRSTDPSTDRPIDRSIDLQTERSVDPLTDVDALGPVVERPRAFYITEKVDRWLDEAVRFLKEGGLHKADRSILVNALLHDPQLFKSTALDRLRPKLLAHLTNKSLKGSQSTD